MEGRKLLNKGILWRVGNGDAIHVWDDPWIPVPTSFRVAQHSKHLWPGARVRDLIDYESGSWKMHLLNALFLKHEAELIKKIPLSACWPQDEIVWHYSRNGIFDVKSAYHLARSSKNQGKGEEGSSSSSKEKNFWNGLWLLNIPPKVRVFIWRACSGILPTGHNLNARIRCENKNCRYCGCEVETDKHIFFECEFAQDVWKGLDKPKLSENSFAPNFKEWFGWVMNSQGKQEAELAAVITWLIWRCRNERIFEGKVRDALKVGQYAIDFLQEYWHLHCRGELPKSDSLTTWVAPEEGILKINVDGAFSDTGAGIGVVVRDHQGQVEALMAERVSEALNAEHVECLAFLKALQFAKEVGISHLILEGDALGIVQRINSTSPDLSVLGNLIRAIRDMLRDFYYMRVSHVRRKNNVSAHLLSHLSLSLEGSPVWFVNFPKEIMYAANADLL